MSDSELFSFVSGTWFLIVAVFFLGFSIFVHELGHFLAARSRGLKVERFSIGFGPPIFRWNGKDGVEYRVSWLPFGGYVALPQLADMGRLEGADGTLEEVHHHQQLPRASYGSKMIALVMGSVFNLIFALLLATFLWLAGQEVATAAQDTRIGTVSEDLAAFGRPETPAPAKEAGLKPGDRVLAVDGVKVQDWRDMTYRIVTGLRRDQEGRPLTEFTIEREGEVFDVTLNPELVTKEDRRLVGIGLMDIIEVGELPANNSLAEAGFQSGDILISYDGNKLFTYRDFVQYSINHPDKPIQISVQRGEEVFQIPYLPRFQRSNEGEPIGLEMSEFLFQKSETIYPNPITQFVEKMEMFYLTLRALVTPSSDVKVRNMSGPVGILDNLQLAASLGFKQLVWFLVFININLAVLNLLPIPVLDGGHMLFATIGKIRGKPLPPRFLEGTQALFVILLFSFMLYVTFFDFGRLRDRLLPERETPPATAESNPEEEAATQPSE